MGIIFQLNYGKHIGHIVILENIARHMRYVGCSFKTITPQPLTTPIDTLQDVDIFVWSQQLL